MKVIAAGIDLKDPKYLVRRRIDLVRKLTDIQDQFNKMEDVIHVDERSYDHPGRDYQGLRFYLLLTCFDILGQHRWMDFLSWLNKEKNDERDAVLAASAGNTALETAKLLQIEYNNIYGVRNSFYRFINEIISPARKAELLHSIKVFSNGVDLNVADTEKLKFLYKIRNSHTHSGISLASAGGFIGGGDDKGLFLEGRMQYGYIPILFEKGRQYSVRRWPNLLFEILEEQIAGTQFYVQPNVE